MVTSLVDSAAGTFTAAYNSDGSILTEVYPSGLAATWTYDNAGNPTSLVYAKGGTVWQTYSATYSAQGQIVQANGPLTQQHYAYDADSRLTQTQDVYGGSCTTRDYGYDQDTNRLTLASHPASSGVTCSDTTTPTSSVSHSYNTGDQLTDTGYTYDAFGRTLTVPAADLTSGGAMTLGYFSNDMVASEAQGTGGSAATDSFTLDPMQNRIRTETVSSTGLTATNHYNDGTDSPAWTDNGDSTWTRDISGIDGNLAAIQTSAGVVTLQLPDLHGDIGATAPNSAGATAVSATYAYTEFGNPETGITPPTYGSLGAKQRSTGDLGGLSIMGQRLYDPTSGRFLQTDPVPGGSAGRYDYVDQDPVNGFDLSGQWHWRHHWHSLWHHWSYSGATFSFGSPVFVGFSISVDRTRNGHWYVSPRFGFESPGFGGNVHAARIGRGRGQHRYDSFVGGWGCSVSGYAGTGGRASWGHLFQHRKSAFAGEIGAGYGAGADCGYGIRW